eukprot:3707615-Pyramimonas_sp.AAC.1
MFLIADVTTGLPEDLTCPANAREVLVLFCTSLATELRPCAIISATSQAWVCVPGWRNDAPRGVRWFAQNELKVLRECLFRMRKCAVAHQFIREKSVSG